MQLLGNHDGQNEHDQAIDNDAIDQSHSRNAPTRGLFRTLGSVPEIGEYLLAVRVVEVRQCWTSLVDDQIDRTRTPRSRYKRAAQIQSQCNEDEDQRQYEQWSVQGFKHNRNS